MLNYLMVAFGGALGAMARFAVYNLAASSRIYAQIATFGINAVGAFLIGLLYVVMVERGGLQPYGQQLLTIGFLGAFTTYSTYSLDALRMFEQGQTGAAILYLLGTMLACLLATWLGLGLTRMLYAH